MIHNELNKQREEILKNLVEHYGKRNIIEIENEINEVFSNRKNIFENLEEIINADILYTEEKYQKLKYIEIFNPKTLSIIERQDFQRAILEYVKKYNELMDESDIF